MQRVKQDLNMEKEGDTVPNRIIKESICTSENIAALSMGAEVLFYHLIVKADDYGVYFGNEQIIRSTCYPLKTDEIKLKQVTAWVNELVSADLAAAVQTALTRADTLTDDYINNLIDTKLGVIENGDY